jgi:hypothetical protein
LAASLDGATKEELSLRLAQAVACKGAAACNAALTAPLQHVPPAMVHTEARPLIVRAVDR